MKPLKIGAYIRVSTDEQTKIFEGSLDSQKHRIDEFVQYKNRQHSGWGDIVEYYFEEGASAGSVNRPMYQKIMNDVRKGKVNLILVSDLTRLSRNLLDFCNLINELEKHKASYLSMKEQFDTSTPIGRMMVYIIIALGQFEREQTSERVSVNHHSRAMRGLRNGGPLPLGYERHPEKPGLMLVNEDEAKIVRTIFATFLEEGSRSKTLAKLNEIGIQPKRPLKTLKEKGAAEWTVQNLGIFLTNFSYVGLREVNKIYRNSDSEYLKPWQQYQVVKASWPALVSEETFYDAQRLLTESSELERTRRAKNENRHFLLTGILRCGETGLPLVGQAGHGQTGTVYRYYHYVRKPKGTSVVRPRLNADDLESKVMNEFENALKSAGYFSSLEKDLKKLVDSKGSLKVSEVSRSKTELEQIKARIKSIWDSQAKMQLNEDGLKLVSEELNKLAKQKSDLEKYIESIEDQSSDPMVYRQQSLFVENNVRACLQGWAKATPAVKKRLLRRTIKEILVTRTELKITFWLSTEEQLTAIGGVGSLESENVRNLESFRRVSGSAGNRNLKVLSSGKVKIGCGGRI